MYGRNIHTIEEHENLIIAKHEDIEIGRMRFKEYPWINGNTSVLIEYFIAVHYRSTSIDIEMLLEAEKTYGAFQTLSKLNLGYNFFKHPRKAKLCMYRYLAYT